MSPKIAAAESEALDICGFRVALAADERRDKVLTAIVRAILHAGANTPLTPKEITARIIDNKYAHLGGLTPHATISSRISTHFKKCNESGGVRIPLLGRLLSESNNRRIKYYVYQFPFEVLDDDYTVIMQPDEPAKPKKATSPTRESAHVPIKRRDSSESVQSARKKRKRVVPTSKSRQTLKSRKQKPDSSSSESDSSDSDSDTTGVMHELNEQKFDVSSSSETGDTAEAQLHEVRTNSEIQIELRQENMETEDNRSLFNREEVEINSSDSEEEEELENCVEQPSIPPQNPQQTYTFSPVFQPHIFMRPNTTSLPPLSTLHQQSVISHLSPPLISVSPALNHQSVNSSAGVTSVPARIFMPSPILLPSPRGLSVLSPQFGPSQSLANIHPLDLGPGLYSSQLRVNNNSIVGNNRSSGNISKNLVSHHTPILNPESISVGELDELLLEHDEASLSQLKSKKKKVLSERNRKRSIAKAPFMGHSNKATNNNLTRQNGGEQNSAHSPRPSALEILKSPPNVFKANQKIHLPKRLFEMTSVHLNIQSSVQQQFSSSSGQIVTMSRLKACPLVSLSMHCTVVTSEKSFQAPASSVKLDLANYVRIGELVCAFNSLSFYSVDDLDTLLKPLWARFCKNLLTLSLSKEPVRPSSPDCEEVDAALSLMGLVSKGDVVSGGDSFAVRILREKPSTDIENLEQNLVMVVVKSVSGGITPDCNGIWIPILAAKFLANILKLPAKVNDLFDLTSDNKALRPVPTTDLQRGRTFSFSSVSSNTSSRQQSYSIGESVDEGYLKFDTSDEEIEVLNDSLKSPNMFPRQIDTSEQSLIAISIDPSILTLVPAKNVSESFMWMTTIEGVFLYITWIGDNVIDPSARSATPGGSDFSPSQMPTGNGLPILRRADNGMVNASQLLNAGGLTTEKERSVVLSLERFKKRIRRPDSSLRGTWIPLSRARELARTFSLDHRLQMFLTEDAGVLYFGMIGSSSPVRKKKGGSASGSPAGLARKLGKPFAMGQQPYMQPQSGPRNIYPPGSLAAIKYAKAQQAAAFQAATENTNAMNLNLTPTAQGDAGQIIMSSPKQSFVVESQSDFKPDLQPKGEDSNAKRVSTSAELKQSQPVMTQQDHITAAELATRAAITSLANNFAQNTLLNPTVFTPPIVAATLAAFATGAKKIIEAVRSSNSPTLSNTTSKVIAPTPSAILYAFANRAMPHSQAVLTGSIADGQFPTINLVEGTATNVLDMLRTAIESAAKSLQGKEKFATLPPNNALADQHVVNGDSKLTCSEKSQSAVVSSGGSIEAGKLPLHQTGKGKSTLARNSTNSHHTQESHLEIRGGGAGKSPYRFHSGGKSLPGLGGGKGKEKSSSMLKEIAYQETNQDSNSDSSSLDITDNDDDEGEELVLNSKDSNNRFFGGKGTQKGLGKGFHGGGGGGGGGKGSLLPPSVQPPPPRSQPLVSQPHNDRHVASKPNVRHPSTNNFKRPTVAMKTPRLPAPVVIQATDEDEDIDILN
ncbi:hypothetical protein HK100_011781 [Physocladia obscura]|uniref:HTH APSES-type domain-containing protein n=1 Tax=Physocladia obscura TaxID=109957 RepID=A0AAD5XGQ8_9FUNG|nr:hypothetical protein HK100_011781 [Physocladia obscura]